MKKCTNKLLAIPLEGATKSQGRRIVCTAKINRTSDGEQPDSTRFKDVFATVCKNHHLSLSTERSYWGWARKCIKWAGIKSASELSNNPADLFLGDHDPSGKDMTRDITDRLSEFSGDTVEVRRLALNIEQVKQYDPPPNPAKITDSRAEGYIAEFGSESWELDALEPSVIADLIREAVLELRDPVEWDAAVKEEDKQRAQLAGVSRNWSKIIKKLKP